MQLTQRDVVFVFLRGQILDSLYNEFKTMLTPDF